MPESKVSVIIPVRNNAVGISECLQGIFSQSYQPYEVIIVDGHSTDETVKNASMWPVQICYEDYHTRAGACQVGLENARGEYIAFTDADCIPDKDWLKHLVNEFGDGVVGLAGETRQKVGEDLWSQSISLALSTFIGSGESVQWRVYKYKHQIRSPSGCNAIYRRDKLIEAGGFTTSLSGGEDEEINNRLNKKGKLFYIPDGVVWHNHQINRVIKFARRMFRYGYWRAESKTLALRVIPPVLAPGLVISLVFTPWIFIVAAGAYLVILVASGSKFAWQKKKPFFIATVPFLYGVGHLFYTFGFWRGVVHWLGIKRK